MKNILVPSDFSKAAYNALKYAIQLSTKIPSKIFLLNSYTTPHSSVMIDLTDILKKDSVDGLTIVKNKIETEFPNITLETISYNDELAIAVQASIDNENIDFVIMGTTGASGMKETFIGSNTASLIQQIEKPLIAIPEDFSLEDNLNIAVSTDLKNLKNISLFGTVKEIATAFNGNFHLINVSEDLSKIDPIDFIDQTADLDELFVGFEHTFNFLENSDYESEILDYIINHHIDLLVVISKKRSFFENLFHKSISKKLTMHSPIPIIILSE